ncbi:hypothetical protein B0H10DRAFT_2231354 [Mycena sp. CBHHK59/15]|nr:hypothetical protein B0H10DRAFT_2231354 [Mycena sp. CBHHK59/15]
MASRAKRNTSNARPAAIVNNTKQKCRTREEIVADNLAVEQARAKKDQQDRQQHLSGVKRVAAKEDALREEDEQTQVHAARPDLVTAKMQQVVVEREQEAQEQEKFQRRDVRMGSSDDAAQDPQTIGHESDDGSDDGDPDYTDAESDEKKGSDSAAGADDTDKDADPSESSDAERDSAFAAFMATYKKNKPKNKSKTKKAKPKKGDLRAEIMAS